MRSYRRFVAGAAFAAATLIGAGASAQTLPMEAIKDSGQAVYPVYEGWYKNQDGSFTMLFGYFNRNSKQALDVAIGPNNRIEPFGPDAGQPTHFDPKRGWGVFTVKVPKDFGDEEGRVGADRERLHQLGARPSRSQLVHRAVRRRGQQEPAADPQVHRRRARRSRAPRRTASRRI